MKVMGVNFPSLAESQNLLFSIFLNRRSKTIVVSLLKPSKQHFKKHEEMQEAPFSYVYKGTFGLEN